MLDRIQLPLRPAGTSLAAHVAALDLLATRLDSLPLRSHWPARIPINSKASFDGDIVHTNQLKVNVGGEWWVEMTAPEAANYVRRRRAHILEEHARVLEGKPRANDEPTDVDVDMVSDERPYRSLPSIQFDPLFAHPVQEQASSSQNAVVTQAEQTSPLEGTKEVAWQNVSSQSEGAEQGALPESLQMLVDMVSKMSPGQEQNETSNEDGLPIHEIREAPDGTPLGPVPAPSGNGVVSLDDDDDDYWSEAAKARREALRKRIFHEGSDDDTDVDDSMDVDDEEPAEPVVATAVTPVDAPVPTASPAPMTPVGPPERKAYTPTASFSSTLVPSVNQPIRANSLPPKGILKAPTRKKSVSFDPSTRLPPESPPARSPTAKFGFPVGKIMTESPTSTKPVPILAPPTPGRKTAPAQSFAGFNRGFLSGPSSKPPPITSPLTPVTPATPHPASQPAQANFAQVEPEDDVDMDEKPAKKQSLFAQRRSESRKPDLPRLADAKPMAAMKTDIVEKTPDDSTPRRSLADRIQTPAVSKPPMSFPPTVGGVPPKVGAAPAAESQPPIVVVDHDDDSDDYGDLGDFSDDEEDEYALDEALLAREVALEYHRRQGWQRPIDEDEIDPEADAGGVFMGVPRVSTVTGGDDEAPLRIVNPTADDLSQFLRVGKAEDGELVFERPIVDSGSESEAEDETDEQKANRRARRARRKDVMERLLRGDYEDKDMLDPATLAKDKQETWQKSLPPTVAAAPASPAPPAPKRVETGPVVERTSEAIAPTAPEPPRKVSRFKAARQAQQ